MCVYSDSWGLVNRVPASNLWGKQLHRNALILCLFSSGTCWSKCGKFNGSWMRRARDIWPFLKSNFVSRLQKMLREGNSSDESLMLLFACLRQSVTALKWRPYSTVASTWEQTWIQFSPWMNLRKHSLIANICLKLLFCPPSLCFPYVFLCF